jgi:hypothetical protein
MQWLCVDVSANILGVGRTCLRQKVYDQIRCNCCLITRWLAHKVAQHSQLYHASCWEDSGHTISSAWSTAFLQKGNQSLGSVEFPTSIPVAQKVIALLHSALV